MSVRLVGRVKLGVALLGLSCFAPGWALGEGLIKELAPRPLEEALEAFSKDTGLQIIYRARMTSGLTSGGAPSGLSNAETLRDILQGTGLQFEFLNDRTVTIVDSKRTTAAAAFGQMSLSQSDVADTSGTRAPTTSSFSDTRAEPPSLEEIVVTAQKRTERLQDVPISISVVGGETLDRSSITSVAEALASIPGVVALESPQSGGNMVAIRGVTASGPLFSGSSPVGYYLDSVPFGFITLSMAPDQSAFDLQRVEVLRGPQGTLYGANAEGGLVRVLTNDANLIDFDIATLGTVSSTDGGGLNYRADAMVNVPLVEGKLAVRAVAGYQDLSGWIDRPAAGEIDSNYGISRNFRLKVNAEPVEGLTIGLSTWSTREFYAAPSTSLGNGTAPGTGTVPEPRSWNYDAYGAKVAYAFQAFTLSSSSSYLKLTNDYRGDLTPFGAPGLFVDGRNDGTVASEELLATSTQASSWRWTLGGMYRDAKEQYNENVPGISPTFLNGDNRSRSTAMFGELGNRFLGEQLEWTLGLRYFHDEVRSRELQITGVPYAPTSADFSSTTPRAVLTWHVTHDAIVYASLAEGFRSGFPEQPAFPQLAPVKPDKLYDYELGAKGDLVSGLLSYDAAVYYYDWRNVQQTLPVQYNFTYLPLPVNGPAASGPGVDLALTVRPARSLEFGATFSWNDLTYDKTQSSGGVVQFNKGDRLNYSAEYTASGFGDYLVPLSEALRAKFSIAANYTSKMQALFPSATAPPAVSEGDSLLFLRLSLALSNSDERIRGMVFIDNATNEHGAYPANQPIPDYTPRPRPRTIGLQLDYRFK